jgi:predicted AlkP superfamily phosphohydrolase/phosphomutase
LPRKKRLVVLSIDGVPATLLQDLIGLGELPNFAQVVSQYGLRQIDSVHPAVSSVAWASFITGRNPGKHGIYGFVDRAPAGYDITIPLSNSMVGKDIWEVLSDAGRRVFGMNVPGTYPPRTVNGIIIGGFLCPEVRKVASPPEVSTYLRSIGYRIDSDPALARRGKDLMLPDLRETLEKRMEAMFHFLHRNTWDYFHAHVMETDRLNHFLLEEWHDHNSKYGQEFLQVYRMIDGYLGELLDVLPEDPEECGLVLLSDHGFCPVKSEVQLSRYLVERGWTALAKAQPEHPLDISPEKSRAYTLIPGRIHLNVQEREPAGIVAPEDFGEVREELARDLLELRAPNGDPVIKQVYGREETYWPEGEHAPQPHMPVSQLLRAEGAFGRGPDLVAVPHDGYDLKMGLGASNIFLRTELQGMHTYHDAFLIARGVELPEARLNIMQVTKYLLKALGLEAPEDMD